MTKRRKVEPIDGGLDECRAILIAGWPHVFDAEHERVWVTAGKGDGSGSWWSLQAYLQVREMEHDRHPR